jgi:predicted ATPase
VRHELPSDSVTLLFTDIEGSTRLLNALGAEVYEEALAEHRRLLREAFAWRGGVEVDTQGDAFFYAFPSAAEAVEAAREGQQALSVGPISVRMGVHTGRPHIGREGYVGEDVHLAARIAAAGHGGQVLVSQATRTLVDGELADLGEHRLKDFSQPVWIFQLGKERFPPLKTISNTNLPRPASSFVGREREVAKVVELLQYSGRLVTLSGPGGSGKTRLAIECAAELVPEFRNGVFWIGLAALRDPALVAETVAQTLGAKDGLADHVGERELLLLLDNFEQVVEAASELGELLERCPNLKLLVTSRELLRIRGEVDYPVPPLAEPEAIELFCARSRLEPSEEITELCARLDDLPLAIELAAARASVLSPAQILERLSQRLDLLKGGRDAESRQQTLRATIAWSYELLTQVERRLFADLAVFAGGCTLEASEAVANADIETLQSLVDKSLVRHSHERFWMLETIRQFALERLEAADAEDIRLRHAGFHRELLTRAEAGTQTGTWLRALVPEIPNLRDALTTFAERGDVESALQVACDLAPLLEVEGLFAEARRQLETLLDVATNESPQLRSQCLQAVAQLAQREGDYGAARAALEKAELLAIELGDEEGIAAIAGTSGIVAGLTGDYSRATACFRESVARLRALGHQSDELPWALGNLGRALLEEGEVDAAQRAAEESLDLAEQRDLPTLVSWSLGILGRIAAAHGDLDRAEELLQQALRELEDIGHPWQAAEWLEELAVIAATAGDHARAGKLWGAAESLREQIGTPLGPAEVARHASAIGAAGAQGPSFAEAAKEGRAIGLDAALAYALHGRSKETPRGAQRGDRRPL